MKETCDGVKEREVGELEEEWGLMKCFFQNKININILT